MSGATGPARRSCVVLRANFLVPDNSCLLVWHLTLALAKELTKDLLFHFSLSRYILHFVLFLYVFIKLHVIIFNEVLNKNFQ